jgi:glycosyltransferase involved in cell wall biosynthesis
LFARHVVGVLSDASLRAKLSAGALQTVSDRFDWRVIGRELSQFACRVAG